MADVNLAMERMGSRMCEIFRCIVEEYLANGNPVGARNLSNIIDENISPATVRNVMQDLESMGLLDSPHISAGRLPTHLGLRLFVDGFLEFGEPTQEEKRALNASFQNKNDDIEDCLDNLSTMLSEITKGASIVFAPKSEMPIKHIEFVNLSSESALAVIVLADNRVENRILAIPPGQTPSSMREASNFLSHLADGRTLSELKTLIKTKIKKERHQINALAANLINEGLATWQDQGSANERLIIRGQANLLANADTEESLERIRALFDALEKKRDIADILNLTEKGDGVQIFIGSENRLFSLSGSSLIVAPYMNGDRKTIGAIGLIGPTRLNYGRIVSVAYYTAQLLGEMMPDRLGKTHEHF